MAKKPKKSGQPTEAERQRNKLQFAAVCVVVPLLFAVVIAVVNKDHACDGDAFTSGNGAPPTLDWRKDKLEFWKSIICTIDAELR